MLSLGLAALALAGTTFAQTLNTATSTSAVYAAQATAKTDSPVSFVPGAAFDRLAIIWLENTDYSKAVGDPNLAALAKKGITLSNYFGVTHPSEPNYVAAIGGDYFGMDNDNFNFVPKNVSTVIDLLESRGISWGEYQEDMPYTGFEGFAWVNQQTKANDYVRKHNPAIIYDANSNNTNRLANIKNLTMFYHDLAANKLPQYMFITPNMTSDGHDTSVTTAGAWTSNFLTPLLSDPNFMRRTLVLVTFDENHTYTQQNRVLALLLGDAVPAELVGTTDTSFYNHYSGISSVSANWRLPTLGRWDVGANVFSFVGQRTGDKIAAFPEATNPTNFTRYFNSSYPGIFNTRVNNTGIPAPNVFAEKNGRTVLSSIVAQWIGDASSSYYTTSVENADGAHPPMVQNKTVEWSAWAAGRGALNSFVNMLGGQ